MGLRPDDGVAQLLGDAAGLVALPLRRIVQFLASSRPATA